MRYRQGYIALITVLIISAVSLVIAATVALLGIGVGQSALSGSKGENALEFAEGCAEDGLLKTQQSSSYSGGNITRPEGTCFITVQKSGNNWTIIATGSQSDYNRTVQVQIVRSSGSPITLSSWQESLPVPTPTPTPTPINTPTPTPTLIPTPTPTLAAPPNWYASNNSWMYRQAITIHATQVSGTQSNFPVLLNLASNTGLQNHAQSTGNDILFTDSTGLTKIPHEIEKYTSSNGALVAWVKVPSISSSADTTIYMYYGNPGAGNQQNVTGTWDSNYGAVWHMNQTPSASILDSTSNANSLTTHNMSSGNQVGGQIDGSLNFNGTNNYLSRSLTSSVQPTGDFTISYWLKLTATPTSLGYSAYQLQTLMSSSPWYGYEVLVGDNGNRVELDWNSSSAGPSLLSNTALNAGQMYYIAITKSGTTATIYLNGASNGSSGGFSGTMLTANNMLQVGAESTSSWWTDGIMDEVRISGIARTASWIQTEYNNQSAPTSFSSQGAEGVY